MPRVLIILPSATYRAHDFTQAAAKLEADLVVASDRRQAMSAFLGDRALVLPLDRPDEAAQRVVEHSSRLKLDAVVAVDDQGVKTAALAARRLGLKTSDPDAVARTRDKAAMRDAFAAAGVPQPDFARLPAGGPIPDGIGYPVVVKPLGLSASRGVIRADDADQAARAAERIRAITGDAGRAAARRVVRAGRRGRGRGPAARRRVRAARDLRQARPARRPLLRGDDLRHARRASRTP